MSRFARTTKAFYSNKNTEVTTSVSFMDNAQLGYGRTIAEDKNYGVGPITISSNNVNSIVLLKETSPETFKKMAFWRLQLVLGEFKGFGKGTRKYEGLSVEDIKADNIDIDLVTISAEDEMLIIDEILLSNLDDIDNLYKIMLDLNDLFRMYQELTIDAAKKLYQIMAAFYSSIMKAASTLHYNHNFKTFKTKSVKNDDIEDAFGNGESVKADDEEENSEEFKIYRDSKYAIDKDLPMGQDVEFYNEDGVLVAISFNDLIGHIQDVVATEVEEFINEDVKEMYDNVQLSEETKISMPLSGGFAKAAKDVHGYVRVVYNKYTAWKTSKIEALNSLRDDNKISNYKYNQELDAINYKYDELIDGLSNFYRYMTEDMSAAQAGKLLYMACNIKKIWKTDEITGRRKPVWVYEENSTNQAFLAIAPELFLAYVAEERAEVAGCGYKLLGEVDALVEGEELDFVNGNANGVYIDGLYTGKLSVCIDERGTVYGIKSIEINKIEHTTPESIIVPTYGPFNPVLFANTGKLEKSSFNAVIKEQQIINKASKVTLYPVFNYTNEKGKTKKLFNAVVATIAWNNVEGYINVPVCQYVCESALFEKAIAGLNSNKVVCSLDGDTLRIQMTYGNFDASVELNHSKVDEEDAFGETTELNDDPLSTDRAENNKTAASDDAFGESTASKEKANKEKEYDEAFGYEGYGYSEDNEPDYDYDDIYNELYGAPKQTEVSVNADMKKADLIAKAEELGVAYKKAWKKEQIIDAINGAKKTIVDNSDPFGGIDEKDFN